MNADTEDAIFLDMVESVTMDVLDRIGDNPERRFQSFKAFVELAKKTVEQVN